MLPDTEKVIDIIRETAATLIVPRFRQLADDDIREKSPGDLVTIADVEAEKHLEALLTDLIPGSLVVGEEEAEDFPRVLDRLKSDAPVWILDPLDGTRNFAGGRTPFTVIVAFAQGGETRMGWIFDPILDELVWAAKGEGCFCDGETLKLSPPLPLSEMKGSLSGRIAQRLFGKTGAPKHINRVGCVGRDYMDLALGRVDFARYAFQLKPWDHAAGVLLHSEAGGVSKLLKADREYHPDLTPKDAMKAEEVLMLAPDTACLETLSDMLQN